MSLRSAHVRSSPTRGGQFGEKKDANVEFPLRLVTGKVLEAKVRRSPMPRRPNRPCLVQLLPGATPADQLVAARVLCGPADKKESEYSIVLPLEVRLVAVCCRGLSTRLGVLPAGPVCAGTTRRKGGHGA